MLKTLLFDLDGTLTDPAEGITNSFIHALKYFGLEIPSYEKLFSYKPFVEKCSRYFATASSTFSPEKPNSFSKVAGSGGPINEHNFS